MWGTLRHVEKRYDEIQVCPLGSLIAATRAALQTAERLARYSWTASCRDDWRTFSKAAKGRLESSRHE